MRSPDEDDTTQGRGRTAAPDQLGLTGRTISPPLSQALYTIAREQVDEEVESADLGMWAGLLRDGEAAADRVPEMALTGDAGVQPRDIDPAELSDVRASTGMIVTRDVEGDIAVRSFDSPDELAAAWSAILVELAPAEPGAPTVAPADSDNNPT